MPINNGTNLLTIGDVYQPSQFDDYAKLMRFTNEMEDAKMRNRISAEKVGEVEFNKRQKDAIIQMAGGEQAYFAQQQQLEEQKKINEQVTQGAAMIKNFKRVLGVDGLKNNWEEIDKLLPPIMKGKLQADNFNEDGYVVKDGEGNLLGTWAENPEGGAPHFVPAAKEPVSTEANYRIGLEKQLTEEHPDWPKDKVKFVAAKTVREENAITQQSRIKFTFDTREQKEKAKEERQSNESFVGWEPDIKKMAYMDKMLWGDKAIKFSWGDKKSYNAFQKGYYGFLKDSKITPNMVAAFRADVKAKDKSASNQKKIMDMMDGFVQNLNKQVGEVKSIYSKLPRTSWKLANIPIKQLRKYVTGSGEEAKAKSYLLEISNEIGKLSTGSSASIRELGEHAQKQWAAIHDESLSFKDLAIVLDATQKQANMRLSSAKDVYDYTINSITAGGPVMLNNKSNYAPFDITVNSDDAKTIADILRKRGVK